MNSSYGLSTPELTSRKVFGGNLLKQVNAAVFLTLSERRRAIKSRMVSWLPVMPPAIWQQHPHPTDTFSEMTGRFIRHERSHVGIADRVLQGHAAIVLRTLFGESLRAYYAFHRRNDIHIQCMTRRAVLSSFTVKALSFRKTV